MSALMPERVAPWKKNNIFGILEVWHANRGRTKYNIYIEFYTLLNFVQNEFKKTWAFY